MQNKKHIIIFSHGFGVRKDDNGLLSAISEAIPEVQSVLFDYYQINEINKTLTICTISKQVAMLNDVINKERTANPDAIIDLICHSQGTIVAAIAKPEGIRKTILLAPVFDMSIERSLKRYALKEDVEINLDGISRLSVLNGLTRFVPAEYWAERKELNPFKEYNEFSEITELVVIEANQDGILDKVDLKDLNPKIQVLSIDGDHGFSNGARAGLIEVLRSYLI